MEIVEHLPYNIIFIVHPATNVEIFLIIPLQITEMDKFFWKKTILILMKPSHLKIVVCQQERLFYVEQTRYISTIHL